MIQKLAGALHRYFQTWETKKHCTDWTFRTKTIQIESMNLRYFLCKSDHCLRYHQRENNMIQEIRWLSSILYLDLE